MKKKIEKAYSIALTKTFKVVNPIKKTIIKTDCKTHINIQNQAFEILKVHGYQKEHDFFRKHIINIDRGLVWADQDFKSYCHFYNPTQKKGMYGHEDNALTLCQKYYDKAIKYFFDKNYEKSMFYFGASCHLVQDMTIPHHAKGKLFDNHRSFEIYIKKNYNKIIKYKSTEKPILLKNVESFIDHNSLYAIKVDDLYDDIIDLKTRFYFMSIKTVTMAQRTTAGFMIMFYENIFKDNI